VIGVSAKALVPPCGIAPAAGSDVDKASAAKCGCRLDFGTVRTSASLVTPCARSRARKSSSVRVEWPMVKIVNS
jgi:hypothetical protein